MARKKRKHWTAPLTKKEKQHLKDDAGCDLQSKASLQRTVDHHAEEERKTGQVVCWECKLAAKKVGVVPKGGWPS